MTLRHVLIAAGVVVLVGVIWLVITDSNVVRSCEHRGGQPVELNGVVTCEMGQP